ncbi:BRO family protein [Breoghania sp.]|uniref:BRO-N domain-containing protein n=1 Tax=Breoghania sp. TaxID=2065378 RepID=UPI002AA6AE24|nr:BRO family protein [Breoghania sp.]
MILTYKVRVVEIDGDPWFVAKDACDVLGLLNTGSTLSKLEAHEVRRVAHSNVHRMDISFPNRGANCVSESGLYALIMRSDKPEAKEFRVWVTQEVLPSIRKNGGYVAGQELVAKGEMDDMDFLARAQEVAARVLADMKGKLKAANDTIGTHLLKVTVDEHRALNHIYLDQGLKVKLGKVATMILRDRGQEPEKQTRLIYSSYGTSREVTVHVYPKDVLDDAAPTKASVPICYCP